MTGQPAAVYFPLGTYSIKSTLSNRVGTVLMGDPTNRPTIRASSGFTGTYILVGHDTRYTGLVAFFHGIKNLILYTTALPVTKSVTILEWAVSQANQLYNVMFNMPVGAMGHSGLATPGQCTQLLYNDLQFVGGRVGMRLGVTQALLKNIYFKSTAYYIEVVPIINAYSSIDVGIGVKVSSMVHGTAQGLRFKGCTIGIDTVMVC